MFLKCEFERDENPWLLSGEPMGLALFGGVVTFGSTIL